MPSKEHLALKFDICTILQSAKPDETVKTASLILSTILAALQEQFEGVEKDPFIPQGAKNYIRKFLAASALGEQSE